MKITKFREIGRVFQLSPRISPSLDPLQYTTAKGINYVTLKGSSSELSSTDNWQFTNVVVLQVLCHSVYFVILAILSAPFKKFLLLI